MDPKDDADQGNQGLEGETPELTEEETQELIEAGKVFKGLRDRYPKINFEELPKAFTHISQENAELKKPKEVAPPHTEDPLEKAMSDFTPEDKEFFQKRIAPVINVLIESQAKAIVESRLKEHDDNKVTEQTIQELTSKHDGSDGLPKFDADAVMDYAMKHQIFNLEAAYKDMHFASFVEHAIKGGKPKPTFTEGTSDKGGIKLPSGKKMSFKDNSVQDAIRETLENAISANE